MSLFRLPLARLKPPAAALALLGSALAAHSAPPATYHRVTAYPSNGAAGALALDPQGRRLYVAHGDRIDLFDADSGAAVGSLGSTPGVQGILVVPELGRGFAADGGDNTLAIFDLKTGALVKSVPSGGTGPAAAAYDPESRRVFVSHASGALSVFDASSGDLVKTLDLGGRLAAMACNGYGRLFVAATDQGVLHVVDTRELASVGDDPVAPGTQPTGLAMDEVGRRLFVVCGNGVMPVVDADAGCVFQVLDCGSGPGSAIFDRAKEPAGPGEAPWKARILAATADGFLTVQRMNAFINYSFHDKSATAAGAAALAFDAKTDRVFLSAGPDILVYGP